MRNHARVLTAIWSNAGFLALHAATQRIYMLLLSQPDLTPCGALPYVPGRWARLAPDTPREEIAAGVDRLSEARFVLVDHDTAELVIRTFVVHDGGLGNPKMRGAIKSALCALHSDHLRAEVVAVLPDPHRAEIVDAIADRLPIRLNAEAGGRRQVEPAVPDETLEPPDLALVDMPPGQMELSPQVPFERAASVWDWLRDPDRLSTSLDEVRALRPSVDDPGPGSRLPDAGGTSAGDERDRADGDACPAATAEGGR